MSLRLNNRHLAILGIMILAVIAARLILADTGTTPLNPGHPLSQTWIDTNLNLGSYNLYTLGNVGIGTASPGAQLDVSGGVSIGNILPEHAIGTTLRVLGSIGVGDGLDAAGGGNPPTSGQLNVFRRNAAGEMVMSRYGSMALNSVLGYVSFSGSTITSPSAQIRGTFVQWGPPEVSRLDFLTRDSDGLIERLSIKGGNVGIGTASPAAKLDVAGDVSWTGTLQGGTVPWARLSSVPNYAGSSSPGGPATTATALASNGANCAAGQYAQGVDAGGNAEGCSTPASGVTGSGTANYIPKWTGGTSLGNSVIYDNGNVGIGTASPGQKLTVAGTIESTSGGIKFPDGTTQTSAAGGITTQNDVTGSRALDTVYQNTFGKPMFVNVVIVDNTHVASLCFQNAQAITDSGSNPTTRVYFVADVCGNGNPTSLSFIVLPGNYYRVTWSPGNSPPNPVIDKWIEWR